MVKTKDELEKENAELRCKKKIVDDAEIYRLHQRVSELESDKVIFRRIIETHINAVNQTGRRFR